MNPRLQVGLIKIPFMQARGGMLATKATVRTACHFRTRALTTISGSACE
jgi:hypothetical protein